MSFVVDFLLNPFVYGSLSVWLTNVDELKKCKGTNSMLIMWWGYFFLLFLLHFISIQSNL